MVEHWGGLRPEQVSDWINFDAQDAARHYLSGAPSDMASLQTEGVAYLWNLLSKQRLALLADEVGMGKTFQALGVAALLWKIKPGARVLVMAPNRDICAHWQREFNAFTLLHYRKADGRVKASDDKLPVPLIEAHYRLADLATAVEKNSSTLVGQLYLTTIHSLSGLVDNSDQRKDKLSVARQEADQLHQRMMHALDYQGFDLLIIDEAHYFRNPQGGTQRAAAARGFFGPVGERISQRTLLLTATPSHTQPGDVANILGYFIDENDPSLKLPAEALMHKYALRRFRLMAGKGGSYTRHQYRQELATPCDFTGRPEAELFFALYQRRLVHELGMASEKRRVLYGFLEGFESAGSLAHAPAAQEEDADQATDERAKDFNAAADTVILHELSQDYRSIYQRAPDHPKYGQLVEQCAPQGLFPMPADRPLHEDKHLIFVRRIPSVRELTQRINEHYDRRLAHEICQAWAMHADDRRVKRWESQQWSREGFNELVRAAADSSANAVPDAFTEAEDVEMESGDEPPEQDAYLGSKIADLFVTKKAQEGRAAMAPTDCSRFSLNLRKSTSIHAMFMEPSCDYMAAPYTWHYEFRQADKLRSDYTKAAQVQRMTGHDKFSKATVEALPPRDAVVQTYDEPIETMWSLVFSHLNANRRAMLRRWATEHPDIAENFGNYIKAGFLFASPVIVELYGWHTRFQRALPPGEQHANVQLRYRGFVAYARQRIEGSLLQRYFEAALDSFEQLCGKIIDHVAGDWEKSWRTLTTLSNPAWYASGESSHRQHLIMGFNSPFYPNSLVATSVFQEGVNLHLQCRKVHHYGIAWTPGDNEQRVGRIDRLFGKVNQLLHADMTTLDINYPYLKNSFDEDQVGSFIERKHAVEEKMDLCTQGNFDRTIHMTRLGWQEFLRKPDANSVRQDPYPARFGPENVPSPNYQDLLGITSVE